MISGRFGMQGQGPIEYLVIVAAIFVVFASVTITQMVNPASDAAKDAEEIAQARSASDKIANAINGVYTNSEGAVITEFVHLPHAWSLYINRDNLRVGVEIDKETRWTESNLRYGFNDNISRIEGGGYVVIVAWEDEEPEGITPRLENNKIYINIDPVGGS